MSLLDRFLNYVKIDTQSSEDSDTYPSTKKQLDLLNLLVKELEEVGLANVGIDKNSYVTATLHSNTEKSIPVIGFIAHVDTSDAVSGSNVNAIMHRNYDGKDIVLPADNTQVIKISENADLKEKVGLDIITADGTTLLGADDKAGIAEIIEATKYFIDNPTVLHGEIKIAFTPDEEVGNGVKFFDVKTFGADYAYTVDGGQLGELEYETFSADKMTMIFKGKSIHPGSAKNKMINSVKIASLFINSLPKDKLSPETTENREGFVHCTGMVGNEEETTVSFIIRDFETQKLKEYEDMLVELAQKALIEFPESSFEYTVTEQYRNMYEILKNHEAVIERARDAMKNIGITPIEHPIRGGTDGARLSFMGLPCPNIFGGGHNFHGKLEWITLQDMELAVKTIVEICKIWEKTGTRH